MQVIVNHLTFYVDNLRKKKKNYHRIVFEDWKSPPDTWSWDLRLFPLLQKSPAAASRKHSTSYTAMMGKGDPTLPSSFNTSQTEYNQTEQQWPASTGAHEKIKRPPLWPLSTGKCCRTHHFKASSLPPQKWGQLQWLLCHHWVTQC